MCSAAISVDDSRAAEQRPEKTLRLYMTEVPVRE
jgi:hypothetical protein